MIKIINEDRRTHINTIALHNNVEYFMYIYMNSKYRYFMYDFSNIKNATHYGLFQIKNSVKDKNDKTN